MAATMPLRSAPSFSIASMVDSSTPVSAPFQPACAAPITRALAIGEQDRAAIGGGDADGDAFGARDDGVGARRVALPWSGRHHGVGRMDLVHAEQVLRRNAHLLGHAAAIFRDIGRIVVRAEAAIEALRRFRWIRRPRG